MEVFLVPSGENNHDLYCELSESDQSLEPAGAFGRIRRRIREFLAAEQKEMNDRDCGSVALSDGADGWMVRMRSGLVREITEWVAGQRLLWRLRYQDAVVLVYPHSLKPDRAMSIVRSTLQRDVDHHRFWMVVDCFGVLVFGPLFFFVPGPNLISWYFAVKVTGHWLAFRGARRGVSGVKWSTQSSEALSALRQALMLPPSDRRLRLRELSKELHLDQLAVFLERTTTNTS